MRENSLKHAEYMRRALELSLGGEGFVNSNPLVGAVIVKDGKVIGEGFHKSFGGPHAEINALNGCREDPEGATMYVTLEPCAHYGKTPPCADAVIKSGIKRVVCATEDLNPLVAGKGFKRLEEAGIDVIKGVLENEARKVNEVFIKYVTARTPFVVLKSAVTLDGKTASVTGDSKWISGEESRAYAHRLRHKMSAVMVGINTVLLDDPALNARIPGGRDPVKVIIDSRLRIPPDARLFKTAAPAIIVTDEKAAEVQKDKAASLEEKNAVIIPMPSENGVISLKRVMEELGRRGIDSLLIEGGGILNGYALKEGIIDKLVTFIAPKLAGGKDAPTFFEGEGIEKISGAIKLKHESVRMLDGDIVIESYTVKE